MGTNVPLNGSGLHVNASILAIAIEQCLKIYRRHGTVVEEALSVAGAHLTEQLSLCLRLDAFDHNGQIERLRHPEHRRNDLRATALIAVDGHKRAVEFDDVDVDVFEHRERGLAVPKSSM